MATASEAIERVAEATGLLHATVFRTARALRESGKTLWPQGSSGRGMAAHVEAVHLTNLVIALAAGGNTTEAPKAVARFADLVAAPPESVSPETPRGRLSRLLLPDLRPIATGAIASPIGGGFEADVGTAEGDYAPKRFIAAGMLAGDGGLGGDIQRVIQLLARSNLFEAERSALLSSGLECRIISDGCRAEAQFFWYDLDLGEDSGVSGRQVYYSSPSQAPRSTTSSALVRTTAIPGALLAVLAELLADTNRRMVRMNRTIFRNG